MQFAKVYLGSWSILRISKYLFTEGFCQTKWIVWRYTYMMTGLMRCIRETDFTFYCTIPTFDDPEKAFETILRKEENAGNQHFLLFPQCFLPFQKSVFIFFNLYLFCRRLMHHSQHFAKRY